MSPWPIVDLDAPEALEPTVAGNKMATLARLRQRGFAVPPGFVVTSAGATALDLARLVAVAYESLGSPPVAVRSSATNEDQPGRSAAGMYETVLDVVGVDAILAAVHTCYASAISEHRQAYAAARDPAQSTGGMAVGVMRMIHPSVSGVAFSCDPLGSGHLIVEAVRGPLEPLVSGRVVPHHVAFDGGRIVRDEPGDDGADTLSPEVREAVLEMTRRVADDLHIDVDIEWAWEGGQVYLLQARPAGPPASSGSKR